MSLDHDPPAAARTVSDGLVDGTFFGVAVLFGLFAFYADLSQNPNPVLVAGGAVIGVAGCTALWWRRRWPVQIGAALTALAPFVSSLSGAQSVMVFTVAVHRRARDVAALAGAGVLLTGTARLLRGDSARMAGVAVLLEVAWSALVIGCGQLVRWRRYHRQRQVDEQLARQEQRIHQIRRLERTRIAREMHDVLAHRISLISMHANALEYRADAAGDEIAQSASVIRSGAHQALEDLREVIGVLRADTDEETGERPQPTLSDIPALIEESSQAGTKVVLHSTITADVDGMSLSVGRTAYRIVQEGLTNARKHAPRMLVRVDLGGAPGSGLNVEVRNRRPAGPSRDPAVPGAGVGLIGLGERTELAGGRLEHGPTPEGEFLLRARLPWPS
jgi:signal transduction histidine kinase